MFTVSAASLPTLYGQHVDCLSQPELRLHLTHELPAVLAGEAPDGEAVRGDGVPGVRLEEGEAGRQDLRPSPPNDLLAGAGGNVAPADTFLILQPVMREFLLESMKRVFDI